MSDRPEISIVSMEEGGGEGRGVERGMRKGRGSERGGGGGAGRKCVEGKKGEVEEKKKREEEDRWMHRGRG